MARLRGARVARAALTCALAGLLACALAVPASATDYSGAIVNTADCTQHDLSRNDDGYTGNVALPFDLNFYGAHYGSLWVNNNGNVTFDGPMSTYTPFTLQATQRAIIAPFFGDVDTRAAGSDVVHYGYGNTTFDGRPAFCVNWINVGYYNQHADKLNSFQLLLVDRTNVAPGDFDIVFNYGSITWEAGDASGGSGGLGGTSARVGFSNGDGTPANSYELSGSGIHGLLLDSSATGLIYQSVGNAQPGRFVFAVRNGQPNVGKYVAMGDSYQSGEGAGDYFPETDIDGVNKCHRSPHAYAEDLVDDGTIPFQLDFAACSGAVIDDLFSTSLSTSDADWNEGAQVAHLGQDTRFVTLGIGGNDLHFADVLSDCIIKHIVTSACEGAFDEQVMNDMLGLATHAGGPLNRLQETYMAVRNDAPRARMLVLGYPKFFAGGKDASSAIDGLYDELFGDGRCQTIRFSDQAWIDYKIEEFDNLIEASARSMGAEPVPMYDVPGSHALCGDDPSFLNGIRFPLHPKVESFHPTAYGHSLIADRIRGVIQTLPEAQSYTIQQGQTVDLDWLVNSLTDFLSFFSNWPGSDVVMTLTSPSGKVYTRSSTAPELVHRNSATDEMFGIRDPEPGHWKVSLYGADVRPGGEPVSFRGVATQRPNLDPTAKIAVTQTGKRTITASAAGSSDADGHLTNYLWDFGDGTFAKGNATVSHTFPGPGSYRVTLIVEDDQKGLGFATADQDFTVVPYPFGGFTAPVNNPPTVNTVKAGAAVPVKFSLGGDQGLAIFDPGYPKVRTVSCDSGAPTDEIESTVTAGASALTYDAASGSYQYVWKTDKAWAGTCRRLVLGLADGTEHPAEFRFR